MNLIGHTENERNLQLDEVVLAVSSDELRKPARFLNHTADRMDQMEADYDHEHLSDCATGFESSPQLVIVRATGRS